MEITLIKYRDAGMSTYTYFWKNTDNQVVSPYFNNEDEALLWSTTISKGKEILSKTGDLMSDKEYELTTTEKVEEFNKKRNYTYKENT